MEGLANPVSTAKTMMIIIVSAILFRCVSAVSVNHTVGESSGWSLSSNLTLWSASNSFFVNDSLGKNSFSYKLNSRRLFFSVIFLHQSSSISDVYVYE